MVWFLVCGLQMVWIFVCSSSDHTASRHLCWFAAVAGGSFSASMAWHFLGPFSVLFDDLRNDCGGAHCCLDGHAQCQRRGEHGLDPRDSTRSMILDALGIECVVEKRIFR